MDEHLNGEFLAYRQYRAAGLDYIEMLHTRPVGAPVSALTDARDRFIQARLEWHQCTAAIDHRLETMEILARAA